MVKRWKEHIDYDSFGEWADMKMLPTGDYVRYDDYSALREMCEEMARKANNIFNDVYLDDDKGKHLVGETELMELRCILAKYEQFKEQE